MVILAGLFDINVSKEASSHVDMIFAGIHWFKLLGNLNNWNIAHNLVEDMDKE